MKSLPLVSVIVPVYNVEQYLPKCIESILSQTFTDFEVILVDDGSTDRSGLICDEYANKDGRISVLHKKNAGVSSARNMALDIAKGEYITFVDSDDYLADSYLNDLIGCIHDKEVDLAVGGYVEVKEDEKITSVCPKITIEQNYFAKFFSEYGFKMLTPPWGKIFKKAIIADNTLYFNENIQFGEDTIFCLNYILYCKKFSCISSSNYYYVIRNGSLTYRVNPYSSEICGYKHYVEIILNLKSKLSLDNRSMNRLYGLGTMYLDRVKNSILSAPSIKEQYSLLSDVDWEYLKKYKHYNSWKERFWDSLLWNKQYFLFLLVAKIV